MDALRTWTIRLSVFEKVKHATWDRASNDGEKDTIMSIQPVATSRSIKSLGLTFVGKSSSL
jgi:hypothetical protein